MNEVKRYKVQFGAKMTELVPLGVEAETRRADDEYVCRSSEVRRLEADHAALAARNAALVEAVGPALDALQCFIEESEYKPEHKTWPEDALERAKTALAANKEKP